MSEWWAEHGAAMQAGLRLVTEATVAMIHWNAAVAAGAPVSMPSNVVSMPTPPGAA